MGKFAGRVLLVWLLITAASSSIGVQTANAEHDCDPTIDPSCVETFDPSFCDPWIDPSCDPNSPVPNYDEPAPIYCDPGFDPSCDPSFCDPLFDPTCDPSLFEPGLVEDLGFCDPLYDPQCLDTFATTVPPALAFSESAPSIKAVVTRADTTDDLALSRIPPGEVAPVAASRLVLGLDALAELGAFRRAPNPRTNDVVRDVRDQVPADGLTDDGYRSEIERLAADLPLLIEQLESEGLVVSNEVLEVANALDEDTVQAIRDGATSVIDARTWIAALADLSIRGGAAPSDPSDRAGDATAVMGVALLFAPETVDETDETAVEEAEPAETDASIAQVSTTTAAPAPVPATSSVSELPTEDPSTQGDSSPLLLIGAALAGLLGLVAFLLIRRRSSADSAMASAVAEATNHKLSVNDLLDASRRMTGSLDVEEIASIALAETERLVAAEGGLLAIRNGEGLSPIHVTPTDLFRLDSLGESGLRRVTETGRSISTVAVDEPVLVEVPMAMAAVPIVTDGTITGAIMVVRVASNPFGRQDIEALEMLAPLVGSALQAAEAHGSATALADVEPMTGLKNRRRLDRDLAATGGELVAYIMLDVDHFKNFNDVNGHAAGDEALKRVASTMADAVRPGDVVYRYGGEEFCVLLPATTAAEAKDIAERVRAEIEACAIPGEENQPNGKVTVSIGVADTASKSVADLVERADAALYEAKDGGRNRVVVDLTDN